MKKFLVAMGLVAFAVVGCDDSSSASAGPNDDPGVESSSSNVSQNGAKQSSSSEKTRTSSSSVDSVSSSLVKSESSSSVTSSSSVEEPKSSSSEFESSSSSSEDRANCSVLLEGEKRWSWDVPKECRFNPDIDYGTMTDERDGKVYRTVTIGVQVWMAENLNFDPDQGGSGEDKYDWSWCYDNEPKNCEVAGRLYTWAAAMDSAKTHCGFDVTCLEDFPIQGICPTGWHLPSQEEWNALFRAVGSKRAASQTLKSQSGWYVYCNGTDAFGFSALPVGGRSYLGGYFAYLAGDAYFWSSTEYESVSAYSMNLTSDAGYVILEEDYKYNMFSVRCIKD